MSRYNTLKTSVVLIALSLLVTTAYPVLALDQPGRPDIKSNTAVRNQLVQEKIANIKDSIASREATLKAKLQAFKDTRKAAIAGRVNANLGLLNQNQTSLMKKYLNVMTSILDKLETRVNTPTPDIKNPAAAKVAIASARAAIASASSAVTTQSQKDYTVQASSEANIRIDAQTQREKLHTDLLTLRKLVINAKQAVTNAIRVAKSGTAPLGITNKEGTKSGY